MHLAQDHHPPTARQLRNAPRAARRKAQHRKHLPQDAPQHLLPHSRNVPLRARTQTLPSRLYGNRHAPQTRTARRRTLAPTLPARYEPIAPASTTHSTNCFPTLRHPFRRPLPTDSPERSERHPLLPTPQNGDARRSGTAAFHAQGNSGTTGADNVYKVRSSNLLAARSILPSPTSAFRGKTSGQRHAVPHLHVGSSRIQPSASAPCRSRRHRHARQHLHTAPLLGHPRKIRRLARRGHKRNARTHLHTNHTNLSQRL